MGGTPTRIATTKAKSYNSTDFNGVTGLASASTLWTSHDPASSFGARGLKMKQVETGLCNCTADRGPNLARRGALGGVEVFQHHRTHTPTGHSAEHPKNIRMVGYSKASTTVCVERGVT